MSRVVVLQHVAPEGPGAIATAVAARGHGVDVVRIDLGAPVPEAAGDAGALVVMGGPMGVYEQARFPHLAAELRLIRSFLDARRPVLGVCLGSQLLAAALGARITPSEYQEIGWQPVHLGPAAEGDALLGGLPETFAAFHWHGDVFDLPPGATPLASSERTPIQAFRHGGNAYGLLFHLEVDAVQVRGMVREFAGEVAKAGLRPEPILWGVDVFLEPMTRTAEAVFGRWAQLIRT